MSSDHDILLSILSKLEELERRQEVVIQSQHVVVGVVEMTNELVVDIAAWIKAPPTSDLGATINAFAAAIQKMSDILVGVGRRVDQVPAEIKVYIDDSLAGN